MSFRKFLATRMPPKAKQWVQKMVDPHRYSYNEDGLKTLHVANFLSDPKFERAYQLGRARNSWKGAEIRWRVYSACWAATHAMNLEGDFVECGVFRGGVSRAVVDYTQFQTTQKTFFLLDTFKGFPSGTVQASAHDFSDYVDSSYADTVEAFKSFENVKVLQGTIPQDLPLITSKKIAYLHIDLNSAEPEISAIDFFWEKLTPGAVVLLDDYAYSEDYSEQRLAFDEFGRRKNVPILTLPTGQGLILKT